MRARQVLRPKEPRLLQLSAALTLAMALAFVVGANLRPWSPKRGMGLGFGVLAAALLVFAALYAARRPRARPLGNARGWLQAHLYAGWLALVAALAHSGFRAPAGRLGFWLLLLALWTVVTGLVGVWLQKWIPAALAEGLHVEAIYERIPSLVDELRAEADRIVAGAGDVLARFYRNEVRAALSGVQPSWAFLIDVRGGTDRALEPFRRVSQFLEDAEQARARDLMSIYAEKLELDAQYSLQGILRGWLVLHVPAAGLLLGLLVVHVFAWAWY